MGEPNDDETTEGEPIPVADPTRPGKSMSDPVEEGDEPEDDDEEETEEDDEGEEDDE